jgi:hypothetical protein
MNKPFGKAVILGLKDQEKVSFALMEVGEAIQTPGSSLSTIWYRLSNDTFLWVSSDGQADTRTAEYQTACSGQYTRLPAGVKIVFETK